MKTKAAEFRHWDVELPDDMIREEHTEGENYWVDFDMLPEGERVTLYSIHYR